MEGGFKEESAGKGLAESEDKIGRMRPVPGATEKHEYSPDQGPGQHCMYHEPRKAQREAG